jgi:chemotaxis signal transduction protein
MLGSILEESWAVDALTLVGSQAYCVSQFEPSPFYEGRPTLIFAAAVRSVAGRTIGGIAVVFDTEPQLAAMLQDAIPNDEQGAAQAGCAALFLDSQLRVLSCTDPALDPAALDLKWIKESAREGEARVARIGDEYLSVGTQRDAGYREFAGLGGYAVVLITIGRVPARQSASRPALTQRGAKRQESGRQESLEFATFAAGASWYAIPTANVIESVDGRTLQSLPRSESWCAGYLMFQGEPLVVADMARLLGVARVETPSIVIVARAKGQSRPFGILVESLGDVPEVPRGHLLPIGAERQIYDYPLVQYAIEAADPRDPMIMVLNAECLVAFMRGDAAPSAEAAA